MNNKTIFTKTAKGLKEASGKTRVLSRDFRNILKEINGSTSLGELPGKLGNLSESKLQEALNKLIAEDYIREFVLQTDSVFDLDFSTVAGPVIQIEDTREQKALADEILRQEKAAHANEVAERKAEEELRAKAEAVAYLKIQAEEKARHEAEMDARRKAEEQARRELEEDARREAEAQATKEAEERARRAAEEQASREAKEKSRRTAEAQAKQDAEERARQKAEEQARRETEERAKKEAEEQVRLEVEAQAAAEERARQEAEEKFRREAEAQAKKETEAKARREADARARKEAQEQVARLRAEAKGRREAEARAKQDAKEMARREAEAQARKEAEEWTQRKAEEQARREAEARVRTEAEKEARRKAEQQALQEAEEDAISEEDEPEQADMEVREAAPAMRAAKSYRKPGKWGKPVGLGLFFLIMAGLGLIHVISFDRQIPVFEKTASELLHQPVKIDKLHLSLVPQPHWRLERVSIGKDAQITATRIKAITEWDTLFSDRMVVKSIEFTSPTLNEEGMGWLLFGKSQARDLRLGRVSATNAQLESQNISLPAFDVEANLGQDGMWKKIVLAAPEKKIHVELWPKGEAVLIEFRADSFAVPFGSTLILEKFSATGMARRNELTVTQFSGSIHDGILAGTGSLKWGANWSFDGELNARQIDTATFVPELLQSGKLEGSAKYALQAQNAGKLFAAPRLEGNFTVRNGTLRGVDLVKLLRSANSSGRSLFAELNGDFVYENGKTQLRKVNLDAGLVSAKGDTDVDANQNLNGRFVVALKSPTMQARANLAVSGTLKEPHFN